MAGSKPTTHPFLSKHRFTSALRPFYKNKKVAGATVMAFVVFGVIATLITNAAELTNEETVLLSSGQQIRLTQSIDSLKTTLGNKLFKLNDQQYIYRQKANDPIEVVIDLDASQKVVVIHLTNLTTNSIASTSSRVGMDIQQVRAYFKNVRSLPRQISALRAGGVAIDQSRSSQYFTPDACSNQPQASLVSLVLKGYEGQYMKDLGGRDCIDPS